MRRAFLGVLLFPLLILPLLQAQRPPVIRPPEVPAVGSGIPTPPWLGRGKKLSGHILGIDPDRMLVRSFEYGNVLFFVDEKTIVRVDKYRLALSDLREGDPVAVNLKEIKGKGPYAVEILTHPDVRRRKEHGGVEKEKTQEEEKPSAAPESPVIRDPQSEIRNLEVPALPRGEHGVTGTVTEVRGDEVTVRDSRGTDHKVMVTGVTRVVRAGSDQVLEGVRAGDRVAVIGDTLETGLLIARDVLVSRSGSATGAPVAAGQAGKSEPLSGEFMGTIVALNAESIRVRTPDGRERVVLVTGITTVRRWGVEVPFGALRKGDQVAVSGDVLEGGTTIAREVNVTKPVSSSR